MLKAVVVALTLAVHPALAGQQPSSVSPSARLGSLRPTQPAKPYEDLFKPTIAMPTVPAQSVAGDSSKPTVVCGMTVIPANPAIDPKMSATPKRDGTRYTIRAIDPPVCAIAPPAPPTR